MIHLFAKINEAIGILFWGDVSFKLNTKLKLKFLAENKIRKLDKLVYLIGAGNEPDENGNSFLHYTQLEKLLFHVFLFYTFKIFIF